MLITKLRFQLLLPWSSSSFTHRQHRSMSSILAPELKIQIARYLRYDKRTLQALSLASHEWLAPAQISLFEIVHFKTATSAFIQTWMHFLRCHPYLGAYVSGLFLENENARNNIQQLDSLSVSEILTLGEVMPNLHTLTISACHLSVLYPYNSTGGPTSPLRSLIITRSYLEENVFGVLASQFTGTAFSFKRNRAVQIGSEYDGLWDINQPFFSMVETLNLTFTPVHYMDSNGHPTATAPLRTHIFLSAFHDHLKDLELEYDSWDGVDIGGIHAFLAKKGSHLDHLTLVNYWSGRHPSERFYSLYLSIINCFCASSVRESRPTDMAPALTQQLLPTSQDPVYHDFRHARFFVATRSFPASHRATDHNAGRNRSHRGPFIR